MNVWIQFRISQKNEYLDLIIYGSMVEINHILGKVKLSKVAYERVTEEEL